MRIIYNLNCIRAPMTGVAYYTLNMVASVIQQFPDADILAFYQHRILNKIQILDLFSQTSQLPKKQSAWKKNIIEIINKSFVARELFQQQENWRHRLTLQSKLSGAIYHEPNFVFLPHAGKKVLTVHDTSMFDCPEYLPQGRAKFLQKEMRRSMTEADALIVSCQFIKDQILKLTHIDEKKIHIIAPGASEKFKPRTESETKASLEKFSLHYKRFLLCVATLEPRKNLVRLIKAYQKLPKHLQQTYPLVLVGNKGWMYEELLCLTQHSPNISLLRYLDEHTLVDIYSAAKLFVYPSLYEGFGLPVLEAMQSGLPVITSNTSSLPEVCGAAGILVDPINEQHMTAAIASLLSSNEIDYSILAQQSLARAQKFSWHDFSEQLFDVYQGC